MKHDYLLEFWADSFHEGNWACKELGSYFPIKQVIYLEGFIPNYFFELPDKCILSVIIYGAYKNWEPLPEKIKYLLEWGKPDLIIYDPLIKKILLAVEETAAIPTGNQALQRCERIFGSAKLKIPFWYLIGEFGVHKDGGMRRDSIWPTILAIRLSNVYKTPCVTLHYSDRENPEDYSAGEGVEILFKSISEFILVHFKYKSKKDLEKILVSQYQKMNEFIDSQWRDIVNYMPLENVLKEPEVAYELVKNSLELGELRSESKKMFCWPTTDALPSEIKSIIKAAGVINEDPIILRLEELVKNKKAYNLVLGAGSKPQKLNDIRNWIKQQENITKKYGKPIHKTNFQNLSFSKTENGNYHLTTAKNVFYLVDNTSSVKKILRDIHGFNGELSSKNDMPVFFYISNSLKPGRIFGDPFTGQLSAFANIFTKNNSGEIERISIAYYPYQVHNQLFNSKGQFNNNKGITIMRDLLDYAIFHNGVIVDLKNGLII